MKKLVIALCLFGGLLASAAPTFAEPKELDGSAIDERVYRTFYSNFKKYAQFACEVDGGYGLIPEYSRRNDSSRGMTVNEVLDKQSEETTIRTGTLVQKKKRTPPREDAMAYVNALPDVRVGSYGNVASAKVLHVIDGNQMIVTELWLIDRDTLREEYERDEQRSEKKNDGRADRDELEFNYKSRIWLRKQQESSRFGFTGVFRIVGYDTRGVRPGERWKGPKDDGFQVGVIKWEESDRDEFEGLDKETRRAIGSRPRLVISELTLTMRNQVDEQGFKKLLKERGMTVQQFVDVMQRMRDIDRRNADERILEALLPPDEDDDDDDD